MSKTFFLFIFTSSFLLAQEHQLDSLKKDSITVKKIEKHQRDSIKKEAFGKLGFGVIEEKKKDSIISDSLTKPKDSISKAVDTLKKTARLDSKKISDSIASPINILNKKSQLDKKKKLFDNDTTEVVNEYTYKDYKIISYEKDTTYLDSSLTIHKWYKYNFLRKDDFEYLLFENAGQPYTRLGRDFESISLLPKIGAEAKDLYFREKEDMKYYWVASPTTELFYKSTMNQGQMASGSLAVNTSEQMNMYMSYEGLRSLGHYKNSRSNFGRVSFTMNYYSKNKRYYGRTHFSNQIFNSKENGGIAKEEEEFESKNVTFLDRSKISVKTEDASSELYGRRFYFDNQYYIFKKDSLNNGINLSLGHEYTYSIKNFIYNQETVKEDLYGDSFKQTKLEDIANMRLHESRLYTTFSDSIIGDIRLDVVNNDLKYYFNKVLYRKGQFIPNILEEKQLGVTVKYSNVFQGIALRAKYGSFLEGKYGNAYIKFDLGYTFNDDIAVDLDFSRSSKSPNLNMILHHSDYSEFTWLNLDFKNEQLVKFNLGIKYKKLLGLLASYTMLDNYTYLVNKEDIPDVAKTTANTTDETDIDTTNIDAITPVSTQSVLSEFYTSDIMRPVQYDKSIGYVKIKLINEFSFWKFRMANTLMYQTVSQEKNILNLPRIVTRNTIYFHSDVFKKAMYLQAGVGVRYFTGYFADGYSPLLGDYYVQNRQKIEGYPVINIFTSARIRQTRIFVAVDHVNSSGNVRYSAPQYPYRDILFRFGLIWDFFM